MLMEIYMRENLKTVKETVTGNIPMPMVMSMRENGKTVKKTVMEK